MSLVSLLKRSIKASRKALWKGNARLDPAYAAMDLLALRCPFLPIKGHHWVSLNLRKGYLRAFPAFPRARRAA